MLKNKKDRLLYALLIVVIVGCVLKIRSMEQRLTVVENLLILVTP